MPQTATRVAIGLYALLHMAGYFWPAELWGVDQLHYYSPWVALAFTVLAGWSLVASNWACLARIDRRAALLLRRLLQQPQSARVMGAAALLLFIGAASLLRVRAHLLGDSDKWFQLLASAPDLHEIVTDLSSGRYPLLPKIPAFESLDFVVHLVVHVLTRALFDWAPADTYSAVSLFAGAFFVAGLWRLCALLTVGAVERVTLVLLVLVTGVTQLFFGYGESYTLVSAATIWFFVFALRGLNGGSLVASAAALLLCLALHLMALGLLPCWLYLVWVRSHRPLERHLHSARVVVPAAAVAMLTGAVLYVRVYPYSLPLLPSADTYSHSLLSLSHLALMGNALLLVSPFGLVWGLATWRRRAAPGIWLLLWAVVGTGGIIFLTNASLGGRDWDMLSYPALCLTIWGVASLGQQAQRRRLLRALRWTVIPLVLCHTLLWVGINAHEGRALVRLENLLQYANVPTHYRYWTLGYYYTDVLDQHYDKAVHYYAQAIAAAPQEELQQPGTRAYSYRKFLAIALGLNDEWQACVEQSRAIYARQTVPVLDDNDLAVHQQYAEALLKLAQRADDQGDPAAAVLWWQESLQPLSVLVDANGDPLHYWNRSSAHRRLGNHVQSIEDFGHSLGMSDTPGPDMIALGDLYRGEGATDLAALAYGQLLRAQVVGLTGADLHKAGERLARSGHVAESNQAYEAALSMDAYNHLARTGLAWNHHQLGRYDDAIANYQQALEVQLTPEAAFGLALSNLNAAYIDSAWAAYDRAVQRFGADVGRQVMAEDNLRRLADKGTVPAAAAILETYWP